MLLNIPERFLFIDTETDGLDPAKSRVIEVAGVLWSRKHRSTITGFSFVMKADSNAKENVNGIPPGLLQDYGIDPAEGWKRVTAWARRADILVAHNAAFDRSFIAPKAAIEGIPWLCTQDDVEFPCGSGGSLVNLLLAHGLGVSHAHRALVDVMNLARLFERVADMDSLEAMLERAFTPKALYKAQVTFDTNALAREAGFRWQPEIKAWTKRLIPAEVEAGLHDYLFRMTMLDPAQKSLF